jgi:DNA-binding MarR family transcriptional regulator
MESSEALSRPIGWWLKEADARLDAAFDRQLVGRDTDRRGWQVLASLARRPASREEIVASLSAFDSPATVEAVLDGLRSLGWIEESAGLLRLTPDGEREHAELAPLIGSVRAQVAAALPQDDYALLIDLLRRLVAAI